MHERGPKPDTAERRTLDIFLVSLAALLVEISFTRVISFKLFGYYTYLAIGLALLGIGCGGVIVATSKRLRAQPIPLDPRVVVRGLVVLRRMLVDAADADDPRDEADIVVDVDAADWDRAIPAAREPLGV